MKKILLSLGLFVFLACGDQKEAVESSTEPNTASSVKAQSAADISPATNEKNPLLAEGNSSVDALREMNWYSGAYSGYQPDEDLVKKFNETLQKHDYQIDVYMGTWCPDSRRVVPKLIKILEMTGSDFSNLTIVTVNGQKEIPNVSPEIAKKLNVYRVPTIIFYENGKEVERFVERSQESLLKDLVKIASGQPYIDSYE